MTANCPARPWHPDQVVAHTVATVAGNVCPYPLIVVYSFLEDFPIADNDPHKCHPSSKDID